MACFLRVLAMGAVILVGVSGQQTKPRSNLKYLGSQPAKIYNFPWMASFHREVGSQKEFMGTGSILTVRYMLGSMDCFVRYSKFFGGAKGLVFYQDVEHLFAYSGSIWGNQYYEDTSGFDFLQRKPIEKIYMFSDPDTNGAHVDSFWSGSQPTLLNTFKRSPFGFSMAIALVKLKDDGIWTWKRGTLPMPLIADRADEVKTKLETEVEKMEAGVNLECYVGGWRNGDRRLVQYRVNYVPISRCQITYCGYDSRACLTWPVQGVHVCFKSESFDDLCWRDQGSALYCRSINESVIAILTSSPTCGYQDLPGVFTLLHHGFQLFERVAYPREKYSPISQAERNKYTPPPKENLHPFY